MGPLTLTGVPEPPRLLPDDLQGPATDRIGNASHRGEPGSWLARGWLVAGLMPATAQTLRTRDPLSGSTLPSRELVGAWLPQLRLSLVT